MKRILICTILFLLYQPIFAQHENISLEFVNGINLPTGHFGDIVDNGFNNEISIAKSFCEKLSLGMGVKHSAFNVKQDFGQVGGKRNQMKSLGFDLGPQFSIGSDRFSVKIYGRTGMVVNSTPEVIQKYSNTDVVTSSLQEQSLTALSTRIGAKINTELCRGIQLFVSGEYSAALNGDITFSSKDISKAIGADGRIDWDLASEIPTTQSSFKYSSFNVNFGVSIDMGSGKRKSNPLYQGNQNQGENPMYKSSSTSGNQQTSGSRAQDYNSSRSNRGTKLDDNNNNSGKPRGVQAQDYNSSKSNRRTVTNTGEETSGSRAQDYNSSRSNRGTKLDDNNNNSGKPRGVQAQDYNSSRSNRRTVTNTGDETSGSRAQDYNSSRSNNSSENITHPNEGTQRGVKAQDYNSSRSNRGINLDNNNNNSGKPRSVQAQDYNSSRSNTTTAIESDDIRESMIPSEKRKIKRKLRKEERKRRKEQRLKQKLKANSIY